MSAAARPSGTDRQQNSSAQPLQDLGTKLQSRLSNAGEAVAKASSAAVQQTSEVLQSVGTALSAPFQGRQGGKADIATQLSGSSSRRQKKSGRGKGLKIEPEQTFLCTGVQVNGVEGQLRRLAQDLVTLEADQLYTVSDIEREVGKVFASGFFTSAQPKAVQSTGKNCFEIAIEVEPNPKLQGVVAIGADALPASFLHDVFAPQCGSIVNFGLFGQSLKRLNHWYQDRGVFGQVTNVRMNENSIAEIRLVEMPVNQVKLMFRDRNTGEVKDSSTIDLKAINRHITTRPGQPFSLARATEDIFALNKTGLFEDVDVLPRPVEGFTDDKPALDVLVSLTERKQVAMSGGGGFKQGEGLGGIFGLASFSHRNLFGQGQRVQGSAEIGPEERTVSVSYVDPWVANNRRLVSGRVECVTSRAPLFPTHGPGDRQDARAHSLGLHRVTAGMQLGMPLLRDWQGTVGMHWQKATCMAPGADPVAEDELGCPLTWSGQPADQSLRAQLETTFMRPNTQMSLKLEQGLPAAQDWPVSSRLHLRAAQATPTGPGGLFGIASLQGGAVYGDLPPYEAFPIGGSNSVRGYPEGALGTGRHFVVASGELRLPLPSKEGGSVQAVAFADFGSDLGSGTSVRGTPARVRGKPGQGYGGGAGLRIDTPIGPLRIEYAVNDKHQRGPYVVIGSPSLI